MTSEQVPVRSFIAGTDWPLDNSPKLEWIAELEARRGQSFAQALYLKEKITIETGNPLPHVISIGAGELEPLEYGLAGFKVTAYEQEKVRAEEATKLVERAGISDKVALLNEAFDKNSLPGIRNGCQLIVLDRVMQFYKSPEALDLLSEIKQNIPSGCRIKAKIYLKDSELFSRPDNAYFSDESWAPSYDQVLGLFPDDTWEIESNSGIQTNPSPFESRAGLLNYSVVLVVKKK